MWPHTQKPLAGIDLATYVFFAGIISYGIVRHVKLKKIEQKIKELNQTIEIQQQQLSSLEKKIKEIRDPIEESLAILKKILGRMEDQSPARHSTTPPIR